MKAKRGPVEVNDYGCDRLRHHHKVKLELVSARTGGAVRLRVLDQTEIDRLYHRGELSHIEHSTAERIRYDLWKIRVYGRVTADVETNPMSGESSSVSTAESEAMARVHETMRVLDREAGDKARRLFIQVMVDNRRVEPVDLPVIRTCLAILLPVVEGRRRASYAVAAPFRIARRAFGLR